MEFAKGVTVSSKSIMTGQPAILYLKTVPSIGWSFIADFIRTEIEIDRTYQNHCTIWVIITGCLLMAIFCALLFRVHNGKTRALWLLSTAISVILGAGIIGMWTCQVTGDITNGGKK